MISTPYSIDGARFVVVRWMTFGVEIFGSGLVSRGVCVAIMPLTREVKEGVAQTSGASHEECAGD